VLPPGFTGRTNDHPGGYTCNNPGMAVRTWSFYGCVVGIVWLLRVTKRECTSGLAVYWEIGDCGNWRLVFQFRNFSISQFPIAQSESRPGRSGQDEDQHQKQQRLWKPPQNFPCHETHRRSLRSGTPANEPGLPACPRLACWGGLATRKKLD